MPFGFANCMCGSESCDIRRPEFGHVRAGRKRGRLAVAQRDTGGRTGFGYVGGGNLEPENARGRRASTVTGDGPRRSAVRPGGPEARQQRRSGRSPVGRRTGVSRSRSGSTTDTLGRTGSGRRLDDGAPVRVHTGSTAHRPRAVRRPGHAARELERGHPRQVTRYFRERVHRSPRTGMHLFTLHGPHRLPQVAQTTMVAFRECRFKQHTPVHQRSTPLGPAVVHP